MTTEQPTTASRPCRRWYQFSLRTLLVLMIVFGIGFAWLGVRLKPVVEHRRAVKALTGAGAALVYEPPGSMFARCDWLCSILGNELLQNVGLVNGRGSEFGDDDMVHLSGLPRLRTLLLHDTQVTGDGLVHLRGLSQLRWIEIRNAPLTDKGLEHLHGLTKLEVLRIEDTQVTDAGVADLQKALPQLTVFR